jgi:predicted nucleic acid-binding Zn ribbon protein
VNHERTTGSVAALLRQETCAICNGPNPKHRHTTCGRACREIYNAREAFRDRWRQSVHQAIDALLARHQPRQVAP